MLFNSHEFIFAFLPVVLAVSWALSHLRNGIVWRNLFLLASSLFFYGYWNLSFLPLLGGSIVFNYVAALLIERRRPGTAIMAATIVINLVCLFFFKYLLFFSNVLVGPENTPEFVRHVVLPIGISFFTFQQVAFIVDVWKRRLPVGSFTTYALFVVFFPQLIAGPVVRYQQIVPQFDRVVGVTTYLLPGLFLFVVGLFKKVVLADTLALPANAIFNGAANGASIGLVDGWIGALSYTFQLYFDFSAYSDMAIGLGLMLGFRLPMNFNSPYKAIGIIDFWRRWHITLSSFFRDYLYIPLGGNRHGKMRQLLSLATVMLFVGLWHGAGWTFIAWGAWHGMLLTLAHLYRVFSAAVDLPWNRPGPKAMLAMKIISWSITFMLVVVGWVIFRAENLSVAMEVLSGMGSLTRPSHLMIYDARYYAAAAMIAGSLAVCLLLPNAVEFAGASLSAQSLFHDAERDEPSEPAGGHSPLSRAGSSFGVIFLLSCAFYLAVTTIGTSTSEFLYFQF